MTPPRPNTTRSCRTRRRVTVTRSRRRTPIPSRMKETIATLAAPTRIDDEPLVHGRAEEGDEGQHDEGRHRRVDHEVQSAPRHDLVEPRWRVDQAQASVQERVREGHEVVEVRRASVVDERVDEPAEDEQDRWDQALVIGEPTPAMRADRCRRAGRAATGVCSVASLRWRVLARLARSSWRDDSRVTVPTILHVDLDAFFAAVEQRDRPELRGKPVIVGGGGPRPRRRQRRVSYEARRFGVHSAMPLREAGRRCPHGVFLPVDGAQVPARVSREVMAILRRFTPLVEPISIDEAFLDVTGRGRCSGRRRRSRAAIKAAVRAEIELTASVGVATTKLVAKVASDLRKPDGLVVVEPGQEAAFLAPLPIGRLWGVGERTGARCASTACARSAISPRSGGTSRAPVRQARRLARPEPAASKPTPRRGDARSRSATRTFDVDTSDPRGDRADAARMADGVAPPAISRRKAARSASRSATRASGPSPASDPRRADRPGRADRRRRSSSPGPRSAGPASACSA